MTEHVLKLKNCLRISFMHIMYFDEIHLLYPPTQLFPLPFHHLSSKTRSSKFTFPSKFYTPINPLTSFNAACMYMGIGPSTRP